MDKERVKAMVENYLEDYDIYYVTDKKIDEMADVVLSRRTIIEVDSTIYFFIVETILTILLVAIITNSWLFSLLG